MLIQRSYSNYSSERRNSAPYRQVKEVTQLLLYSSSTLLYKSIFSELSLSRWPPRKVRLLITYEDIVVNHLFVDSSNKADPSASNQTEEEKEVKEEKEGKEEKDGKEEKVEIMGAVAIKPPGWDRTGWDAVSKFFYDGEAGTFLMRTPLSWLKICKYQSYPESSYFFDI